MNSKQDKREQLRAARRKHILEAALRVFMEKGFHVTNVSDVAAKAGVSQGTIYWYFESKDELFNAALVEYFADFGQDAWSSLDGYTSADQKLQALGEAMAEFAAEAAGMFAMFLGYMAAAPERAEAGRVWSDLLVQYKEGLVGIIEEGILSGEFRDVDAEPLAWAMMAAFDGLAAYLLLMPGIDIAKVAHAFVEALIAGVRA